MSKIFFPIFLVISFLVIFFAGCKHDDEETVPAKETGTVTDIDGNVYATVKIGNKWWMAENLKVKHYRNGANIASITDAADWTSFASGAFYAYRNESDNFKKYGLLYNWYAAADTSHLAPDGWHIPGDNEWKELERALGMSAAVADGSGWRGTHEGEKLKIEANKGWTSYKDIWATNESGFTALAGSCRLFDGTEGESLFSTGFWWTSTVLEDEAWYRYLDYKNTNIFRAHDDKRYGFSIRCVKD